MIQDERHDFLAWGELKRAESVIPVKIRGAYHQFDTEPVSITISPEKTSRHIGALTTEFEVMGKAEDGEAIWFSGDIRDLSSTHYQPDSQVTLQGDCDFFQKGDLDAFDASDGEVICSVFITPTYLALAGARYIRADDGTITFSEHSQREGIRWELPLGTAELIDNYEYKDVLMGPDAADVRVRRCQIVIHAKSDGHVSFGDLLRQLDNALEDSLWLISMIGRDRVTWYAAEVVFVPNETSKSGFRSAFARKKANIGFKRHSLDDLQWRDVLIQQKELRKGLFKELYAAYVKSEYKETIRRAIVFLVMSYDRIYFEGQLGNAYSALETLVNGLSPDADREVGRLLNNNSFKRLSGKISELIRVELSDENIADAVIRKIPELNRRAILDKLTLLLKRHLVPIAQLLPAGADATTELHRTLSRRNVYIHQGKLENINEYFYDMLLFRDLSELWILKLLACPDEKFDPEAWRYLEAIRAQLPSQRATS